MAIQMLQCIVREDFIHSIWSPYQKILGSMIFHSCTDLVVGLTFSALLGKMFGKGIGFFVSSISGPILTVFGSTCFDYFPNIRNVLSRAFLLVQLRLTYVQFPSNKAFILVDNHGVSAFAFETTFIAFEITFVAIAFLVAEIIIVNINHHLSTQISVKFFAQVSKFVEGHGILEPG